MSTSVSTSFVRQYERRAHEAYQRQGTAVLRTVRWQSDVEGESTTFQVIGTGTATTKARHGTITPMNQNHTAVPCTLADFYAGDWVDKLDLNKLNIDEQGAIARGGAAALGRKVDDQLFTAMNADNSNLVNSGHSGNVTRNILLEAVETLDANDVPRDGRRYGTLTPRAWSHAMTISQFADADFVGDDLPFKAMAQPRTWLGVHWMVHSGLPGVATTTAELFVWHQDAIGYGSNPVVEGAQQSVRADITWHGDRAAWFINHMMSGGACVIDGNGLIEIQVDDTTALS